MSASCNYVMRLSHVMKYSHYRVATISRLLKIIGLFCKRALLKRLCSAQETYHFILRCLLIVATSHVMRLVSM